MSRKRSNNNKFLIDSVKLFHGHGYVMIPEQRAKDKPTKRIPYSEKDKIMGAQKVNGELVLGTKWTELKHQIEITDHYLKKDGAVISVITGEPSNLICLDLDNKTKYATEISGTEVWNKLVEKYGPPFVKTPVSRKYYESFGGQTPSLAIMETTPSSGMHYFFRYEKSVQESMSDDKCGVAFIEMYMGPSTPGKFVTIDYKGDNKKITVCPSSKENGSYVFKSCLENGFLYKPLYEIYKDDLPMMADWVKELIAKKCIDQSYNIIDRPEDMPKNVRVPGGKKKEKSSGEKNKVSGVTGNRSVHHVNVKYVTHLLKMLPPSAWQNYGTWEVIMKALHNYFRGQYLEDGWDIFDYFSREYGEKSYDTENNRKQWDALNESDNPEDQKIGLSSLEEMVRDYAPERFNRLRYIEYINVRNYPEPGTLIYDALTGYDEGIAKIITNRFSSFLKIVGRTTPEHYVWNADKKLWQSGDKALLTAAANKLVSKWLIDIKSFLCAAFAKYNEEIAAGKKPTTVVPGISAEDDSGEEDGSGDDEPVKKNVRKAGRKHDDHELRNLEKWQIEKLKSLLQLIKKVQTNSENALYQKYWSELVDEKFAEKINEIKHLIPTKNGKIVDLKTLKERDRVSTDYFTYECPSGLIPKSDPDRREKLEFVEYEMSKLMCGDYKMVAYLRKLLGYCITGEVDQKEFYVFNGSANGGKSSLVSLLTYLLGPQTKSGSAAIWASSEGVTHTAGLYSLLDCRVTFITETDGQNEIRGRVIKQMTGADALSVAKKGKDFETRKSYAKLIFATNYPLCITLDDHAMVNRVRYVPFCAEFVKDPKLVNEDQFKFLVNNNYFDEVVKPNIDAFFTWIAMGSRKYYQDKSLGEIPLAAVALNEKLLKKADPIALYIELGIKLKTPQDEGWVPIGTGDKDPIFENYGFKSYGIKLSNKMYSKETLFSHFQDFCGNHGFDENFLRKWDARKFKAVLMSKCKTLVSHTYEHGEWIFNIKEKVSLEKPDNEKGVLPDGKKEETPKNEIPDGKKEETINKPIEPREPVYIELPEEFDSEDESYDLDD